MQVKSKSSFCRVSTLCSVSSAVELWKLPTKHVDGSGTIIALLDTGINIVSPAFKQKIIDIKNFVDEDDKDSIIDADGHGTLCAGIAAGHSFYCPKNMEDIEDAETGKTKCYCIQGGVAPGAKLIICKVAKSNTDSVDSSTCTAALMWLKENYTSVNNPVNVVSISLSWQKISVGMAKVFSELTAKGVVIVCCATNEGQKIRNPILSPADLGIGISIGSHDRCGNRSTFSSVGKDLDFLALGENVVGPGSGSKGPFSVASDSGTSFSTPAVAGLVCLLLHDITRRCEEEREQTKLSGKPLTHYISNVWMIKKLLREMSTSPGSHSQERGYGCLEPNRLLKASTQQLVDIIANFVEF